MTHLEEFTEIVQEASVENLTLTQLESLFLGAIAANTAAILDKLEEMNNGNKL